MTVISGRNTVCQNNTSPNLHKWNVPTTAGSLTQKSGHNNVSNTVVWKSLAARTAVSDRVASEVEQTQGALWTEVHRSRVEGPGKGWLGDLENLTPATTTKKQNMPIFQSLWVFFTAVGFSWPRLLWLFIQKIISSHQSMSTWFSRISEMSLWAGRLLQVSAGYAFFFVLFMRKIVSWAINVNTIN